MLINEFDDIGVVGTQQAVMFVHPPELEAKPDETHKGFIFKDNVKRNLGSRLYSPATLRFDGTAARWL